MSALRSSTPAHRGRKKWAVRRSAFAILCVLVAGACAKRAVVNSSGSPRVHPEPLTASASVRTASVPTEWSYEIMPAPQPSTTPIRRLIELNFPDPSSTGLNREANGVLRETAAVLKKNLGTRVLIVGFADGVRERDRGQKLASARADKTRAQLVRLGVAADRMEVASFGSALASAGPDQPLAQQTDRKVEIWVLGE